MPLFSRDFWNRGIDLDWIESAKVKISNDKTFDSHLSDLFRRGHISLTLTYPVFAVTVALPHLVEAIATRVWCMRRDGSHTLRRHDFLHDGRACRLFLLCLTRFDWSCFRDRVALILAVLALWRGNSKFLQLLLKRSTHRLLKKGVIINSEWKS